MVLETLSTEYLNRALRRWHTRLRVQHSVRWLPGALIIGLGLAAISTTPVMLAVVQDQFPDNRATANGIFMFLNFLTRAIAILAVGVMADNLGLTVAFVICGALSLLSIPGVFRLPKSKVDLAANGQR